MGFADMIKLMILKCGDYPALAGWTLNAITSIFIRGVSDRQRRGRR